MVGLIADLAQDWRRLDERIAAVSAEIEALVKHVRSFGAAKSDGEKKPSK